MEVHPVLLVDRRSNVVFEVIRGDPDMDAARDFEWLPSLGCYVIPFLGFAGGSVGVVSRVDGLGSRG